MDFLPSRPRRNRKSAAIREFVAETHLSVAHFVYPLFIHGGEEERVAIPSMPGCYRLSVPMGLKLEVAAALEDGVRSIVLFPAEPDEHKTPKGEESFNPNGLVQSAIKMLKKEFGSEITIYTDVALDPYSSDGHDGIVDKSTGTIVNDETVQVLCKQAVSHAVAGADVIAPSDMMDGRIGAIRRALDNAGFSHVSILSYCAKYASAYYGPFRDALDSHPGFGDKKTYQMDPRNSREALREIAADEAEGADVLMVKPAGPYLDVISRMRQATALPVAAYQVSGEFAMIKAAAQNGWLDEKSVMLESLYAIRRAGADLIFTYFARDAAKYLNAKK